MDLGFRGEIAELYHRYRHGYPAAVVDAIAGAFALSARDSVVDLGCGTGQLTVPMASRVRAVLGVDPEPDMLARGRLAAEEQGIGNISWMIGSDSDLPALGALLADRSVGALTIGQALHWMRHEELFRAVLPLVRGGGGIAVVTNGTPLWLQDTIWSRALRGCLEEWLQGGRGGSGGGDRGAKLTASCGTDEQSQQRYRAALAAAGYEVLSCSVSYQADLSLDQVVGGILSALGADRLPPADQRPVLADRIRHALEPDTQVTEHVRVALLLGRKRQPRAGPAPRSLPRSLPPDPGAGLADSKNRVPPAALGSMDGDEADTGRGSAARGSSGPASGWPP